MPMSTFPHSSSIVRIDDRDNAYFGHKAKVHSVMAHNGCQADPVLTVVLLDRNICFATRVSKVTVLEGLSCSFDAHTSK